MTTTPSIRSSRSQGIRVSTVTAALAGVALVLTACSGGGDADAEAKGKSEDSEGSVTVYNFDSAKVADSDEESFVVNDEAVTVALSDELQAAVPSGKAVAVEQFTVKPKIMPTGLCRVDVHVEYADGGLESVQANPKYDHQDTAEKAVVGNLFNEAFDDDDKVVDEVPSDDDVQEDVHYLTSDFENYTFVGDCNEGDDETFVSTEFPYNNPTEDDTYFAAARISIMPGGGEGGEGAATTISGDTKAELSANGKWVTPEE